MHILILDNQPATAAIMALSLRTRGHVAQAFTSVSEALKAIHACDVLLVDYHLSEMTGLEVAWRAYEQGWRGSLLIMSGDRRGIAEDLVHPLLQTVLDKPFSAQMLAEALPRAA